MKPNLKRKKNVDLKVSRGEGEGSGWWEHSKQEIVSQTVKRGKIQNSNHLHNVKHVIQSEFQKM